MLAEQRLQQRDFSALGGFENCCSIAGNASTESVSMVNGWFCTRPLIAAIASGRGGEQQRLTFGRGKADHLIDGLAEAHIQHPIGFIHHQRLQRIQRHGALLQVIQQTTRRGDDDMRRMLQRIALRTERLPAAKGQNFNIW